MSAGLTLDATAVSSTDRFEILGPHRVEIDGPETTTKSRRQVAEIETQERDHAGLTLHGLQPWDRKEDRRNAERLRTLPRHTDCFVFWKR